MQKGLTFAEAYLIRKAKEEADAKKHKEDTRTIVSNIEDLQETMGKIVHDIENDAPLKTFKLILNAIPPNFDKYIADWTDNDKLNILHHAIIHNRPALVNFLLAETHYFPPRHIPYLNPYAHLAAIAGHTECLRAVLHHRPGSFFTSDKPSHAIKLPEHLMRELRLSEKMGSAKSSERLLDKIKSSTKDAEKRIKHAFSSASSDITVLLDTDIVDIEKSFQKEKKHLKVLPNRHVKRDTSKSLAVPKKERLLPSPDVLKKDGASKEKRSTVLSAPPLSPTPRQSLRKSELPKLKHEKLTSMELSEKNHLIPQLKPRSGQHQITVYWNIASRFEQGVVRGAGEPVKVQFAPNSHLKPQSVNKGTGTEEVRSIISSWPSTSQRHSKESVARKAPQTSSNVQPNKRALNVKPSLKSIEVGVRAFKKYKDFQIKIPPHDVREKDEQDTYMNKTPLTYAAEKGHEDCVQLILAMVIVKRNPGIALHESLTLATKARSPETIVLLVERPFSREDFQNAVLLAIREMYPVCLTALLNKGRGRNALFDGVNLFHILYSQCVISGHRFELMPEMTRALIACKEDVNSHNIPRTFPMYTLIHCAFNITIGKQIFFFIECLHILLENKANPHFDELKQSRQAQKDGHPFGRKAFSSAISCIFGSAKGAVNFFEKSYWSRLFMKKFVTTIEMFDITPRRVLNTVLFEYMDAVCELGLDRTIVRCLLRYGANPDYMQYQKYPVNVYFDKVLPYLTRFEIINSYAVYGQELDTLVIICKSMSMKHLTQSLLIFLKDHLLSAPIQALPITRQFAAIMDNMVRNPRPLAELAGRIVWMQIRRNKTRVNGLPITQDCRHYILP